MGSWSKARAFEDRTARGSACAHNICLGNCFIRRVHDRGVHIITINGLQEFDKFLGPCWVTIVDNHAANVAYFTDGEDLIEGLQTRTDDGQRRGVLTSEEIGRNGSAAGCLDGCERIGLDHSFEFASLIGVQTDS